MPQHPLSRLDSDNQQYVSACCRDFRSFLPRQEPHLLEKAIEAAPSDARLALLCELLPIEIEHIKLRTGKLPTLHELSHAHPTLKELLPAAYKWVPGESRVPDAFGRYKTTKVIGEGGQGCVVQARDELDDRLVAIKYAWEAQHVRLLRREQMFLADLAHKNIIQVLGWGDEPGLFYIVLPLRRGESLQLAYAHHRPSPKLAAEITLQIARAIAHMHAQNVVHRDIKPGNIHLDPQSPEDTVVLLDLGLAVALAAWNAEDRRVLEHGGTKAYMAPEQLASDENSDPKLSDVYALGAVLFFLLVGEPPQDKAAVHTNLLRAKVPDTLRAICRRSLESRPADRQASAAELSRELGQYLTVDTTRRAVFKYALPFASVVTLLASFIVIWNFAPGGRAPEASPGLVDQSDRITPLDYGNVSAADFQVSVECDTDSRWVVGGDPRLLRFPGKLAVRGTPSTDAMLAGAEFRFHNGPWRNVYREPKTNLSIAELTEAELLLRGPLYIRFTTLARNGSPTICGPFRYSVYLDESLDVIKKQLAEEIAKEWIDKKYDWIGNSIFFQKWSLRVNRYRFPWTPVVALRFGTSASEMVHSIDIASYGLETIADAKDATESGVFASFYYTSTEFDNLTKPLKDSHSLFAQLHFFDGSKSEVREFLADLHPQSEQSIRRRKHLESVGFGGISQPLVEPVPRPENNWSP
ncbi:serine/threonine-protein kinase [Aeoliella sp. SH292]|uniref:serine/threonine-protein kinase n=1 Tax=Aeoliella sp. SH292 TaxID=3454464 RepID=UPI003F9AD512